MKALIIILIVVLILQTAIYVYAQFIDITRNRQQANFQEQMKNIQADFLNEKQRLQKIIDKKNEHLEEAIQNWKSAATRVEVLNKLLEEKKEGEK